MYTLDYILSNKDDFVFEINFQSTKKTENLINSLNYYIWINNNTIQYKNRNEGKIYPLSFRNVNSFRFFEKKDIIDKLDICKMPVVEYFEKYSGFSKQRFFNRHFNEYKINGDYLILTDDINRFSNGNIIRIPIYTIISIREQKENEQLLSLINEYSTKELFYNTDDEILLKANMVAINSLHNRLLNNYASKVFFNEDIDNVSINSKDTFNLPFLVTDNFNYSQLQAIIHAINNDLTIIQGPPGTGKTTSIVNIITSLFALDNSILFTSNNSDALRNLEKKLRQLKLPLFYFRIGKPEDIVESIDMFIETFESYSYEKSIDESILQTEFENMKDTIGNSIEIFDKLSNLSKVSSIIRKEEFNKFHNNIKLLSNIFELKMDYRGNIKSTEKLSIYLKNILKSLKKIESAKRFKKFKLNSFIKKYCNKNKRNSIKEILKTTKGKADFINNNKDIIEDILLEIDTYIDYIKYNIKIADFYKHTIKEEKINVFDNLEDLLNYTTIKDNYLSSFKSFNPFYRSYIHSKYKYKEIKEFYLKIKGVRNLFNTNFQDDYEAISKYMFEEYINNGKLTSIFNLVLVTNLSQVTFYKKAHFDYAIIDEASQSRIFNALMTLQLCDSVVLVGDTMQFSPIIDKSLNKSFIELNNKYNLSDLYNEYNYSFLEIMEKKAYIKDIFLLDEHYRCDDFIIHYCNENFYNNRLIPNPHIRDGKKQKKDSIEIVRVLNDNSNVEKQLNKNEAKVIYDICNTINIKEHTGIITPYRQQRDLITKQLSGIVPSRNIGTISAFQGQEYDTIIISLVATIDVNGNSHNLDFMLNNPKMLNIAVSRAIRKLYLVGDVDNILNYLKNNNKLNTKLYKLINYAKDLESMSNEEAKEYINVYNINFNNLNFLPNLNMKYLKNEFVFSLSNDIAQEMNKFIINTNYEILSNIKGKEFIKNDYYNRKYFTKIFDIVIYKKMKNKLNVLLALSENLIIYNEDKKMNKLDLEFLNMNDININKNISKIYTKLKSRQTYSEIKILNIINFIVDNSEYRKKIVIGRNVEMNKVIKIEEVTKYNNNLFEYAKLAHFDYVLYYKINDLFYPYLVVELDGNEHRENEKSILNDIKKNKICNLANLSIIRIPINLVL